MIKRLLIFILIIGGVLYFGLRDDADKVEKDTQEVEKTENAEETSSEKEEVKNEEEKKAEEKTEVSSTKEDSAPSKQATPTKSLIGPQPQVKVERPVIVQKPRYTAQSEVKVYMYDWEIDLSALEVPAGNVTFTVQNTGKFSHNFGIKGGTDFGRVNPGSTVTFDAYLIPGVVGLYSSNARDIERGMEETLTVR